MFKLKLAKPMLVALAACAASVAFNGVVFADDAQTQALKDQMRIMQQQMQQLQNQIDALSKKQAAPSAPSAAEGPSVAKAKEAPASSPPPIRWSIRPIPIRAMCEVLPKEAEHRRWATWVGSRNYRRTSR